jgi:hypothetical protein
LQVQPSTDGAGNLLSTSHSLASWRPLDSQDVNTSSTRGAAGEGGDTPQPGWTGARQLARLRAVNQARTSLDVSETCLVHSVTSKVLKKLQEGGQSPAAGGVASGLGPHSNGPWRSHPAAAAAPISGFASGPNAIGADGLWRGVCSGGSQLPPRPSQAGAGTSSTSSPRKLNSSRSGVGPGVGSGGRPAARPTRVNIRTSLDMSMHSTPSDRALQHAGLLGFGGGGGDRGGGTVAAARWAYATASVTGARHMSMDSHLQQQQQCGGGGVVPEAGLLATRRSIGPASPMGTSDGGWLQFGHGEQYASGGNFEN